MSRARLLLSLLVLAGLLVGLMPGLLSAREVAPAQDIPPDDVVVRLYFDTRARLDAIAAEYDVWEVHHDRGYAVVPLSPAAYVRLLEQGYRLEIDADKTNWLGIDAPLDPRFYFFDDDYPNSYGRYVVDFLQATEITYTNIVELIDIGDAWEGENGGYLRDLWVLRITNEDPAYGDIADKPPFYLMAEIHAREVTTPEMAIRYIKYLTSGYNGEGGYGIDPDVTWLVDRHTVYVEVMANPDGHRVNEENTGVNYYGRRKNMDNDDGCNDWETWGVDLNRNHSFFWNSGGSSSNPCSDTYRGPSIGSEPETQYFQHFITDTVFTDWNGPNGNYEYPPAAPDDASGVMITLHTYSDLVLWPWGHTQSQAPNGAQLQTLGRKLAYFNNYTPQQAVALYATSGTTDDWTYGILGVASYTFEIGPDGYGACSGFFPDYECMEGEAGRPEDFWAENKPAFLYAHKVARTPYMTSYGPDTQNLTVTPNPVPQGVPVDLTALIQDHRYGGDPLAPVGAAEYFIDEPGADGAGSPMSPQDSSWGGTSETAIATVDTSSLAPGRHYILVHGKKSTTPNDHWGPFTAIFLEVEESGGCYPVEILDVITATDGCSVDYAAVLSGTEPIAYDWDFGALGSSTEPTPTVAYGLPGTYPYTLTVTNCITGTDTASGTVTVDCCVPPSNAAFAYAPPNPLTGEMVVFTGTAESQLPITYSWAFGDGGVGSGVVVTHVYTAGGAYTVIMTATNACGTAVASDVVAVGIPNIVVSAVSTPTLQPEAILQGGLVISNTGGYTLSWTLAEAAPIDWLAESPMTGTTAPGGMTAITLYYTAPVTPGVYTGALHILSDDPDEPQVAVPVALRVVPLGCEPVKILTVTPQVDGCVVTLTAELTGTAPFTYLWAFGDGATSTDVAPTHTYAQTGAYSATLDVWNCSGIGHDASAFTVQVECAGPQYWVYLPLVIK